MPRYAFVIVADGKRAAAFARSAAAVTGRSVKLGGCIGIAEIPADIILCPGSVVGYGEESPPADAKFLW